MNSLYREPVIEEGKHNLILQNRCGSRLTLLVHEEHTELEWVYKPNAFRRKEFRARNFSNRDNQTTLFRASALPEIGAAIIKDFDYDPFVTRLEVEAPSTARNCISIVNVIDENCFAIAADRPLTLTFSAHNRFNLSDGLLTETFTDRGEEITSFVAFNSYEENRFRILEDGRAVLQIYENELVFVGGEENVHQVQRVVGKLRNFDLQGLITYNEERIRPVLQKGAIRCNDADFQRVIDLNKRVVYSGLDAGGASFGALNRIYYLIWNRDGAMTTSMAARAGNPDFLRTWTPFILNNPAMRRNEEGRRVAEWLQILGSRWTKSEDDGIFYAALSMFTLYQTTGESDFLNTPEFTRYLDALDYNIATRFSEEEELFGSDTRGETTLAGSPLFGYDTVNGSMPRQLHAVEEEGREFRRVFSLYHNVNLFNTLRMTESLLGVFGDEERAARYRALAERLQKSLSGKFVNEQGFFHADYVYFADDSRGWVEFANADYWEYAWAVSVGPFFPNLGAALRSARMVVQEWPQIRAYGYCPWNTLSRFLKEHGLSTESYVDMLRDEVREALMTTQKFPLRGALTEYYSHIESWRGLPFSAGSFLFSLAGLLLQSLPMGLAVRASTFVDEISDFAFRTARIDAVASGEGDVVQSWQLNGRAVVGTLQIPESLLRTGRNRLQVARGTVSDEFRLHASSAALLEVQKVEDGYTYLFSSAVPCELLFENYEQVTDVRVENMDGEAISFTPSTLEDTNKTTLCVNTRGDFYVLVHIAH